MSKLKNVLGLTLGLVVVILLINANHQQHVVPVEKVLLDLPAEEQKRKHEISAVETETEHRSVLQNIYQSVWELFCNQHKSQSQTSHSAHRPIVPLNIIREDPATTTTTIERMAENADDIDDSHDRELGAVQTETLLVEKIEARSATTDDWHNHQKKVVSATETILRFLGNSTAHDADTNYNYIPGRYTDRRNNQLLTSKAVSSPMTAGEHLRQVLREAKCGVPQMRCVRVAHETSKNYSPHCIRLHRCTEDSGCCHSRDDVCAPKTTQEVILPFHVKKGGKPSITENLSFVNHTECHCVERSKYMSEFMEVKLDTIRSCKCPKFFDRIIQNDGKCRCDCSSGNTACESLKNGEEHFSITERTNISKGIYKAPTCQFDTYLEAKGRCPNANGQFTNQFSYNALVMS